jgi:hypothetical protein
MSSTTWRMGRYINALADFYEEGQYFIIEGAQVYHEGDERSRTHPGHGYPAYSESVVKIRAFDDMREWESVLKELATEGKKFKAFTAVPAKVTTELKVEVTIPKLMETV